MDKLCLSVKSDKDDLKMRCKNVKLFFRGPLILKEV